MSVAGFLVNEGRRVLVIDLDPQANATISLGINPSGGGNTIYDVLMSRIEDYPVVTMREAIRETRSGIDLVPSTLDLVGAEPFMYKINDRFHLIANSVAQVKGAYDMVLIDTPPSMGQFMISGLIAADHVVVTFDKGLFSIRGFDTLMTIFSDIKEMVGDEVRPAMAILTQWEILAGAQESGGLGHLFQRLSSLIKGTQGEVSGVVAPDGALEAIREKIPVVYTVPFSREVDEAQRAGVPISHHSPECPAGVAYRQIAAVISGWS